jgi:hypothetical protein
LAAASSFVMLAMQIAMARFFGLPAPVAFATHRSIFPVMFAGNPA